MVGVIVKFQIAVDARSQSSAEGDTIGGCLVVQLIPLAGILVISPHPAIVASAVAADWRNREGVLSDGCSFNAIFQNNGFGTSQGHTAAIGGIGHKEYDGRPGRFCPGGVHRFDTDSIFA